MKRDRHLWEDHVTRLSRPPSPGFAGRRPSKYGNRENFVDGIRFSSRLEADRYVELCLLTASGQVLWFLRQVPFDVAPGVKYRADYLVVWNRSGSASEAVTVEDTKGMMTSASRVKIAVVEQRYGIRIRLLRRADVGRRP